MSSSSFTSLSGVLFYFDRGRFTAYSAKTDVLYILKLSECSEWVVISKLYIKWKLAVWQPAYPRQDIINHVASFYQTASCQKAPTAKITSAHAQMVVGERKSIIIIKYTSYSFKDLNGFYIQAVRLLMLRCSNLNPVTEIHLREYGYLLQWNGLPKQVNN